jgi:dipeptidyl aminopeptidase/acylaminoacyl peptidase
MRYSSIYLLGLILMLITPVVNASYVPYSEEYGIYRFNSETGEVQLVFSSPLKITNIDLSPDKSQLVFSLFHGDGYEFSEIYTIKSDGSGLTRITNNTFWDLYPNWGPDGANFLFLSWRNSTLDIYTMESNGDNQRLLYDSGGHDADIDWVGNRIVFTRDSQIWIMNSDGTGATQLTDPPDAGVWGEAVLPFGDYDPRISPDESMIVFERMVDDSSPHGNYELFIADINGENEHNITGTGWTQGIAQWSSTGEELIYLVSAMGEEGRYDIFKINRDGTDTVDLTSELFPEGFIAHHPIYAEDENMIYFVGQWWNWEIRDSSITCLPSSSQVSLGDQVTVTGEIKPQVLETEIQVTVTTPSESVINTNLASEDGTYSHSFSLEELGDYTITASWIGDKGHKPSTSTAVTVSVEDIAKPQSQGIPGFPITSIITALGIYYLIREKLR